MTVIRVKKDTLTALATSALLAIGAQSALAADSPCKGLEKPQCESKDQCTWVDSYKRKDGVQVDGYCRSKGKRKSSSSGGDKS
jgi:hypothetical protein